MLRAELLFERQRLPCEAWEDDVNKAELIEALAGRLGDRKTATAALDAVLTEIQNAVTKGDKVSITGFGVFEKRDRAARTARNPRTGQAVRVKKTSVPAFRPGTGFKELVATGRVARVTRAAPAKKTATKAVKKTTAKKAAPAKRSTRAATSPSRRRTSIAAPSTRRRTTTATKRVRSR